MKPVLVVDDENDIREAITEALRDEGFEVVAAATGEEALSRLREVKPSVVLLDLMMPGMSGWEFRAEQKHDPNLSKIPVIVVSAMDRTPEPELEADRYIQKPFDLEQLLEAIRPYTASV